MASIFDILVAQQTGQPMPDDPLSALMASSAMPMPPQPQSPFAPWIDLRAQRPPQPPAPSLFEFLRGLLPGSPVTDAQMAAVPGAVPPIPSPGFTPPGVGMQQLPQARPPLEASSPLGPALAQVAQAVIPPPVQAGVDPGAIVRPPPIPAAAPPVQPPAPTVTWGLPPTQRQAGTQSVTIGPSGQVGPTPAQGDPMLQYANAIKSIESAGSGGYSAIGATHPKLGRALGAYQVMEANVGPWTEEILGKKMTAEEFLKDPAAQDAVFRGKFGQFVQEYGSPQEAASVWFTGQPIAKGANRKDVHGTTGNAYVDKFSKALNQPAQNAFGLLEPRQISAPQLPIPGATEALKGLDPRVFAMLQALQPTAMPKLSTGDKIANVLGEMAGGAKGAKNIGDVLLGAGAGAGRGATENIMTERGDLARFNQQKDALARLAAETEVEKGRAAQQGENYQIQARNRDKELLNQVATEQAKLDTAAKNRMAEIGTDFDREKWKLGLPQPHITSEGISVVTRTPEGGIKVDTTKWDSLKSEAEKMEQTIKANLGDKAAPAVQMLRYQNAARAGEPYIRMEIARDMIDKNEYAQVLGPTAAKKLEEDAKKAVPIGRMATDPKQYDKDLKAKMLEIFLSSKPSDQVWLPKMFELGNFGAMMLRRAAPQPGV
jgi:hypothetical protein